MGTHGEMQSKTVGTRWSLPRWQQEGAPSHYNPDRENARVRDHRPPASVPSLKGVRGQGRPRAQPGGFGLRGASPAPGKTPALLFGPGGAVRRGDRGSAHLKRSRRVWGVPVRATLGNSHAPPPLQPRLRPPLRLRPQLLPSRWWRRRLWPQAPDPSHRFSPSSLPLWQRPPAPPASKARSHWPAVPWRHARVGAAGR